MSSGYGHNNNIDIKRAKVDAVSNHRFSFFTVISMKNFSFPSQHTNGVSV